METPVDPDIWTLSKTEHALIAAKSLSHRLDVAVLLKAGSRPRLATLLTDATECHCCTFASVRS